MYVCFCLSQREDTTLYTEHYFSIIIWSFTYVQPLYSGSSIYTHAVYQEIHKSLLRPIFPVLCLERSWFPFAVTSTFKKPRTPGYYSLSLIDKRTTTYAELIFLLHISCDDWLGHAFIISLLNTLLTPFSFPELLTKPTSLSLFKNAWHFKMHWHRTIWCKCSLLVPALVMKMGSIRITQSLLLISVPLFDLIFKVLSNFDRDARWKSSYWMSF